MEEYNSNLQNNTLHVITMELPIPEWLKELKGRKCHKFGDIIVCIRGTDKYLTYESLITGKPTSMVEICFGRVSKPNEFYCVRVFAPPSVSKASIDMVLNPLTEGVKNIIGIVDEFNEDGLVIGIDRSNVDKKDIWYCEVEDFWSGKISRLAFRIMPRYTGKGEFKYKKWMI